MKKNKIILVTWTDASLHTGWYDDLEDIVKNCSTTVVKTVGWYVGEAKGCLILSVHNSVPEDMKDFGHAIWIPKSCIISKKNLK